MLKKIFKTIFIMSLCIGISLPTNAAVSVSDGSAFVTKAEFAADLNNLSNRMAQLENSLDAKIDSLVSSYLTRNGIWNGANQELNTSIWKLNDSSDLPGKSSATLYDKILNKSFRIVNSLTKTGLCSVIMSQKAASSQKIFGMLQVGGTFTRVWDSSFALFGYFTCESTYSDISSKVAYPVGSGYGKAFYDGNLGSASQSFGVFTQTTEIVNTYYFFVQKGDFIDTYFHVAYFVPGGSNFSFSKQEITFEVKNISVY